MEEAASPSLPRVTEQIIRNNIARNLSLGLDIASGLKWGVEEYFQMWGDGGFPWERDGTLVLHQNTALSAQERAVLEPLVDALNAAWSDTEGLTAEEFLETSWPPQINRLAVEARAVMASRGCFSEDVEEDQPSSAFAFE